MENYIKRERRRPLLLRIIGFLSVLIMLGTAAALLLSYLAVWVNPYLYWYIAFLGLAAPILMLVNLFFLFILGIRMSKLALVPLLTLLLGIGYIGDYVQFHFVTEYPSQDKPTTRELKILTYNVHGFGYHKDASVRTLDSIISFVAAEDPDIVCFQEFQLWGSEELDKVDTRMNRWKYSAANYITDNEFHRWGIVVYSKYPLKNATAIKFLERENSSMYVDVIMKNDTIRLFNNHLQSTQFNNLNKEDLRNGRAEAAARIVGSTLRANYGVRSFQADTIRAIMDQSPYRNIAVGDFNDTPMSYVYHKIRGEMYDTFREKGKWYEYTYKRLMKLFRIDYILHTDGIETLTHTSPDIEWSDHNPVISTVICR